jgi:mono/diheme cytochrome c family protein
VGGKGGRLGPSLDFLKRANSPVLIAAALWNHGPEMVETLKAVGIERPTFAGRELADIIAYVQSSPREAGTETARVVAGTPERGEKLAGEKRCLTCHSVAGKGGKIGPELGRHQHVSLTQFAALMWNHAPGMWAQMKARGIQLPRMTGQEMADIVAYLYASHYFDQPGDMGRGQQLLQSKGCASCHAVRGQGAKVGADLASYPALRSAAGLVASLWNHPRYLAARQQEVPWPTLTGQELSDLAAFVTGLSRGAGAKPKTP